MHICLYVDTLGTVTRDQRQEYERAERYCMTLLRDLQPTFQRDVTPAQLLDDTQRCELYIIDIGGLAVEGAEVKHWLTALYEAILQRPQTLFVFWTVATTVAFWDNADRALHRKLWRVRNIRGVVETDLEAQIKAWFAPPAPPEPEPAPEVELAPKPPASPVAPDDSDWGDLLK